MAAETFPAAKDESREIRKSRAGRAGMWERNARPAQSPTRGRKLKYPASHARERSTKHSILRSKNNSGCKLGWLSKLLRGLKFRGRVIAVVLVLEFLARPHAFCPEADTGKPSPAGVGLLYFFRSPLVRSTHRGALCTHPCELVMTCAARKIAASNSTATRQ